MGNLGGMRGSIFLMRIGPPRRVQGTMIDTRRTFTPPEGSAMYSFAREVLIPHLETHLGWNYPVVNVTTFIVVKAGTVDVEKKTVLAP